MSRDRRVSLLYAHVWLDKAGKPYVLENEFGQFFEASFVENYMRLAIEIAETYTAVRHAAALDGARRRAWLEQLDGVLLGKVKAILDMADRTGTIDNPAFRGLWDLTLEYEAAIKAALEGDVGPLLAVTSREAPRLADLAAVPTRGRRTFDQRVNVLGQLTAETRRKGQPWLETGAAVLEKLRPLVGLYDWAVADCAALEGYIATGDSRGVRELLRYAYEARAKRRGKPVRRR